MDKSVNKVDIRKFMKQQKKKNKERETLEKSQEIEKHNKVQENLKVLHAYIKKIRKHPHEEQLQANNRDFDEPLKRDDLQEASKSDSLFNRKYERPGKYRKNNNRSRLYENENKIFDFSSKNKNNISLDTKKEKHKSKHIKYTTLLSNDKDFLIYDKNNTSQRTDLDKVK